MPDPAKTTQAELRYEVRIINGPYKFTFRSVVVDIPAKDDLVCLMRVVKSGRAIIDEKIVGIIGDEWRSSALEFLNLREFLSTGGVIGLNRDLVY